MQTDAEKALQELLARAHFKEGFRDYFSQHPQRRHLMFDKDKKTSNPHWLAGFQAAEKLVEHQADVYLIDQEII